MSFSLRELQELEEDRITREKREARAREEAAMRAREEAARREAETLAAKERAEAEAREVERRRELEEMARREAMQKAIVEQARIEVDAKARAQEAERERQHEIELARLRAQQAQTKPGIVIGAGLGGALFVLVAAFAIHAAVLKPATEARIAAVTDMATRAESRAADAERRTEEQKKQIDSLAEELRQARAAKPPAPPASSVPKGGKHAAAGAGTHQHGWQPKTKNTGCDPHDPMCFDAP